MKEELWWRLQKTLVLAIVTLDSSVNFHKWQNSCNSIWIKVENRWLKYTDDDSLIPEDLAN